MKPSPEERDLPIPVICLDPSAVPAFRIFNPNDWYGRSRAIVQSCATEFSVVHYNADRIHVICQDPKGRCQRHFENIQTKLAAPERSLPKTVYFAQDPELHASIEGFLAGIKSVLDLIVQLLTTEGVVGSHVHGFHRKGTVYGGEVLNLLDNNAMASQKEIAHACKEVIIEHKVRWIDDAIKARDSLVHPIRGAQQLMFQIKLAVQDGRLVYETALPPSANGQSIEEYSSAQLTNIEAFAHSFLAVFPRKTEAA